MYLVEGVVAYSEERAVEVAVKPVLGGRVQVPGGIPPSGLVVSLGQLG